VFPLNLYARVHVLVATIARETAGAARTRSSLRPLIFMGQGFLAKLRVGHAARMRSRIYLASFRDGPKDQTRKFEIPGSMLRIAPE
jgi:hypothetical protein